MTLSDTLNCDRVMDGAFSPQPDFQVPEGEMGQYTCYDVARGFKEIFFKMNTYMNPFLYNGLYISATVETFHLETYSPNPSSQ
jgi:hypothetical protein